MPKRKYDTRPEKKTVKVRKHQRRVADKVVEVREHIRRNKSDFGFKEPPLYYDDDPRQEMLRGEGFIVELTYDGVSATIDDKFVKVFSGSEWVDTYDYVGSDDITHMFFVPKGSEMKDA